MKTDETIGGLIIIVGLAMIIFTFYLIGTRLEDLVAVLKDFVPLIAIIVGMCIMIWGYEKATKK